MKKLNLFFIISISLLVASCKNQKEKTEKIKTAKKVVKEKTVLKKQEAPFVYGIDISSYQGDEVRFINAHKDSLGFIICKATQGAYYTDPDFTKNSKDILIVPTKFLKSYNKSNFIQVLGLRQRSCYCSGQNN